MSAPSQQPAIQHHLHAVLPVRNREINTFVDRLCVVVNALCFAASALFFVAAVCRMGPFI